MDKQGAPPPKNLKGMPRPTRVKNKSPAPIQITAEQIVREAMERQGKWMPIKAAIACGV